MTQQNHNDPPMGSSLDSTFGFRRLRRLIRNLLLVGLMAVLFADAFGAPYLRWEYRYQGSRKSPIITDATYIGIGDRLEADSGEYGRECPLVLLIKPSPSLCTQAVDYLGSFIF